MLTSSQVADYFIARAHEAGDPVTNLKLQKLVYYAQAWHLALYRKRLIRERFQAWVHGPVEPELYARFKPYGWSPIDADVEMPDMSSKERAHLDDVFEAYGAFTALQLERMTHAEAPWLKARDGIPNDEPSTAVISEADMTSYYRARVTGKKAK